MSGGTLDQARESLRLARLRTLMFALLLVGLPLGITISLIAGRSSLPATSGAQPGGPVRGRVVHVDGTPATGVPLELIGIGSDGSKRTCAETTSGDDGRFVLEAPALDGKYALGAGGGELRRTWRELSFLDRKGLVADPGELELRVEPGCTLTVELVRATDRYAGSGRYELRGRLRDSGAFGLLRRELSVAEEFDGGAIELDGLPPFDGELLMFLSNGDEVMLELALDPGTHVRRVEL